MVWTATDRYRLLGGPASPYSLKVRSVLRYRRLPHDWVVPRGFFVEGSELAATGHNRVPVLKLPEGGRALADSTPLIFLLEQRHPGVRSVLPPDPARSFLAHLIETLADEWFVHVLFHYKWRREVDRDFCATRQMLGWLGSVGDGALEHTAARFRERQVAALARLDPQGTLAPLYEETFAELLTLLDAHLKLSPFLFGERPSLADFGLFGPLSQLCLDPTPQALVRARSLRVLHYTLLLDDASGVEGDWDPVSTPLPAAVMALLRLAGEFMLPLMCVHAQALEAEAMNPPAPLAGGEAPPPEPVHVRLRGAERVTSRQRYPARCLRWLQAELASLPESARATLEPPLRETGCWPALQLPAGVVVDPMLPL